MYIKIYKRYFRLLINILLVLLITIKFSNAENTINTSAKYALLIDHDTGRILLNKNADVKMAPASMSKLMTVYLAFEAIKQERMNLDTELIVSENAW